MCFSAQASFAAAAVLAPIGIYTMGKAVRSDPAYLGFATFPLFFGLQQLLEGFVWVGLDGKSASTANWPAIGFLFFAYFFWPVLVPFSSWLTEVDRRRQIWFGGAAIAGAILGLALLAPILVDHGSLSIQVVRNSIRYDPNLLWANEYAKTVFRIIYAIVVCAPLLAASDSKVRVFGVLITISVVMGFLLVSYAFTSVWCFFAALLSAYIVVIVRALPRSTSRQREPA